MTQKITTSVTPANLAALRALALDLGLKNEKFGGGSVAQLLAAIAAAAQDRRRAALVALLAPKETNDGH